MIINHKYKFCYFAIPRTASTATSKVLMEDFESETILRKHTSYEEFMEQASEEEKKYFKFTSIRNPLDSVISAYFKKKNDHNQRFSTRKSGDGSPTGKKALAEYDFIVANNASFSEFFKHFYTKPYHRKRHEETVRNMDAIIRFENLNEDFAKVMKQFNLETRGIPLINSTSGRKQDFVSFYTSDVIAQAIAVFAPLMKSWGYSFPEKWL